MNLRVRRRERGLYEVEAWRILPEVERLHEKIL